MTIAVQKNPDNLVLISPDAEDWDVGANTLAEMDDVFYQVDVESAQRQTDVTNLQTNIDTLQGDLQTNINNESSERQAEDDALTLITDGLKIRIDNLVSGSPVDSSMDNGHRIYMVEFFEIFSSDQIDGLDQRLNLLNSKIGFKISGIDVLPGIGISIDNFTEPSYPRIITNNPIWNSIQNKPATIQNIDTVLLAKSDKLTTYTKTETNTVLAVKSDKVTTYTKSEVDAKLLGVGNSTLLGKIISGLAMDNLRTLTIQNNPYLWENLHYAEDIGVGLAISSNDNFSSNNIFIFNKSQAQSYSSTSSVCSWRGIARSQSLNLWVIVGIGTGINYTIITSTDGNTWTNVNNTSSFECVIRSEQKSLFIAAGQNGAFVSADGVTWTLAINQNIASVVYAEDIGRFVAIGYDLTDAYAAYSDNGTSWTPLADVNKNKSWKSVCRSYKLSEFLAVSADLSIMKSTDGINWLVTENILPAVPNKISYFEDLGVYLLTTGFGLYTSFNGISWTKRRNETFTGITYNGKDGSCYLLENNLSIYKTSEIGLGYNV